jgi:hypothetical protein
LLMLLDSKVGNEHNNYDDEKHQTQQPQQRFPNERENSHLSEVLAPRR